MSLKTYAEGDSIPTELMSTKIGGVEQDMSAAGWECHISLSNIDKTEYLVQDRPVTKLVTVGALQSFEASLTEAECNLLVSTSTDSHTVYYWTIQLMNKTLDPFYREETDIIIPIRPGRVSL